MQLEKVKAAFERKGFPPNAYIDKREYIRVLNSLTPGGEFHEQVASELWAQTAGERPSRELRVSDICGVIVEAQTILQARISETNQEIRGFEAEKRRLQGKQGPQTLRRIEEIDQRVQDLYAEKQSFEDDYRLVTEPFGIQLASSLIRPSLNGAPLMAEAYPQINRGSKNSDEHYQMSSEGHVESSDLKLLLYLTLGFGLVEVIMIYGKYDFLNLIVLTCLLSIYLMNFFDKVYVRLALALLGVSILLDLVWVIMEGGSKWNPPKVSNSSVYMVGYQRFIVFFTVTLIIVKAAIIFILFKYRNITTADKYQISLGLLTIFLDANKGNPFSKQLVLLAGQN